MKFCETTREAITECVTIESKRPKHSPEIPVRSKINPKRNIAFKLSCVDRKKTV